MTAPDAVTVPGAVTVPEQLAGLRVTRGRPTAAELAAVVAALAVVARTRGATAGAHPEGRSDRGERLRRTPEQRGPGAWRASGWR